MLSVPHPVTDTGYDTPQKEEYDVGDDIYTDENMKIEDMIQKSIYLMESYLKGTRLFENDIKEYALKF